MGTPPPRRPVRLERQQANPSISSALWLGGVHAEVQEMLVHSGLADDIGRAHLYRDLEDAVGDASA